MKMVAIYTSRQKRLTNDYARLVHPDEITKAMKTNLEDTVKYLNTFHGYEAFVIVDIETLKCDVKTCKHSNHEHA